MTIVNDEMEDNLKEADTRYTEDDIFTIQTSYDPEQNIEFDPGRKGCKEDDFAYEQRIIAYTERERERAELAVVPKNLHDFSEKVCPFYKSIALLSFHLQLKAQVVSGKRSDPDAYIRLTPKVLDGWVLYYLRLNLPVRSSFPQTNYSC